MLGDLEPFSGKWPSISSLTSGSTQKENWTTRNAQANNLNMSIWRTIRSLTWALYFELPYSTVSD